MNEIKIRQIKSSDRIEIENICIATAPPALRSTKRIREITLLMYNRYYTRVLTNSFAAVNSDNKVVGYILCAADFDAYKSDYTKTELKAIRRKNIFAYFIAKAELKNMEKYCADYPAHLHIDILPEYQRMNIGSKLMNALVSHLKDKNIKGLMLCVSPENKGAVSFYEHCGFKLISDKSGLIYAMKF